MEIRTTENFLKDIILSIDKHMICSGIPPGSHEVCEYEIDIGRGTYSYACPKCGYGMGGTMPEGTCKELRNLQEKVVGDVWICETERKIIPMSECFTCKSKGHKIHNTKGKGLAAKVYSLTPKGARYALAMDAFEAKLKELEKLSDEEVMKLAEKKYEGH